MSAYKAIFASDVSQSLEEITSKKTYQAVKQRILAFETFPYMGAFYDALYPSAMPPHQLHATYVDHYGIYYTVDEEKKLVNIEYIEDSHRNPFNKFRFTKIPTSEA